MKKKTLTCEKQFTYKRREQAVPHREKLIQKQGGLRNIGIYRCSEHDGFHVGRERVRIGTRPRGRIKR